MIVSTLGVVTYGLLWWLRVPVAPPMQEVLVLYFLRDTMNECPLIDGLLRNASILEDVMQWLRWLSLTVVNYICARVIAGKAPSWVFGREGLSAFLQDLDVEITMLDERE